MTNNGDDSYTGTSGYSSYDSDSNEGMSDCLLDQSEDGIDIIFVDILKTEDEATKYCEKYFDGLAPIRTEKRRLAVEDALVTCVSGTPEDLPRNKMPYRIGLKFEDGKGRWSDGVECTKKSVDRDGFEFLDQSVYYFHGGHLNEGKNAEVPRMPFLCYKSHATSASEVKMGSGGYAAIVVSIIAILLLILNLLLFLKLKKSKLETRKQISVVEDLRQANENAEFDRKIDEIVRPALQKNVYNSFHQSQSPPSANDPIKPEYVTYMGNFNPKKSTKDAATRKSLADGNPAENSRILPPLPMTPKEAADNDDNNVYLVFPDK